MTNDVVVCAGGGSLENCDEGNRWGIHNGTSQRRQKHSVHYEYVGNYPKDLVFFLDRHNNVIVGIMLAPLF